MANVIKVYPLINYSCGYEEFRLMNVSEEIYNKSIECGGSDELKQIIRERLENLFAGGLNEYFDEDVTGEVEECINELAKGHDSAIKGEQFWWCNIERTYI
jgi:hypothetical protein